MDSHAVEVVVIVLAQLVSITVYVVTTRERITALNKRVDAHDASHKEHYQHSSTRGIHEESMDAKLIEREFHSVRTQLNQHAAEDLRVSTEIKSDLKDIRAAVQDVREHLSK